MAGYASRLRRRQITAAILHRLFLAGALFGLVVLAILLVDVLQRGMGSLSWDFVTSYPSRFPERAGILSGLAGTVWVIGLTAIMSFPIGVGAAIYLEEYAPPRFITRLINTNIANLAGVPSIVYGILGLAVFVRLMAMDRTIIAAALTMTLLVLPIIIVASQEAIRTVPGTLRQAAYALGASKWQVVRQIVLPYALPGMLTGSILAVSRAIGETAPLLVVGAVTFIAFVPNSPADPFSVLPVQIFNWSQRPSDEFRQLAAAGIIVLLIVLLAINAGAIILRNRLQKRSQE